MNSERKTATLIGMLFIIADVSAMIAVILYGPILNNTNYLTTSPLYDNQIILGALMELILIISAIGTSIVFYPILKREL